MAFTHHARRHPSTRPQPYNRQDSLSIADISYRYTRLGNVEQMKYPQAGVMTDYWYNKRGWLDSLESQYTIVAPKIFTQKLEYDSVGRIIKQESKNASQAGELVQSYGYDNVDRLQKWYRLGLGDTVLYEYDKVGNRTSASRIDGGDVRTYQYGTPTTGPNRLQEELRQQLGSATGTEYSYNENGSVTDRVKWGQAVPPLWGLVGEEHFGYSYRELNWKYVGGNPLMDNHSDWRYRYNAMGEREQKRLYHAPLGDSIAGQPYPWVYYLLGGSKDQLAVWHGQQMTSPFCDTVRRRNVLLYPTEYLTYGVGKQSSLVTRPDGSKEYRFFDHLGSSRAVLGSSGFSFSDYAPFGGVLGGGTESRKGFIDKEKDGESSLRNLGVRQYDDEGGRFLSIDPKAQLLPSWSPYVFALNNPIIFIDPDGQFPYTFHVRSFHPDKTFGGGFMGDDRGFSNDPISSARIAHHFTFDPSTGQTSNKGFASNFSLHALGFIGTRGKWGLGKEMPNETHYNTSGWKGAFNISTGYAGSNPLTPGLITPDIDVHSNFSITENLEKGTLSIRANITGDDFPSAEAFLTDHAGNSVFILTCFEFAKFGEYGNSGLEDSLTLLCSS